MSAVSGQYWDKKLNICHYVIMSLCHVCFTRVIDNRSSKSSPIESVFIFIGEFMFSIGELLVFIGENL